MATVSNQVSRAMIRRDFRCRISWGERSAASAGWDLTASCASRCGSGRRWTWACPARGPKPVRRTLHALGSGPSNGRPVKNWQPCSHRGTRRSARSHCTHRPTAARATRGTTSSSARRPGTRCSTRCFRPGLVVLSRTGRRIRRRRIDQHTTRPAPQRFRPANAPGSPRPDRWKNESPVSTRSPRATSQS